MARDEGEAEGAATHTVVETKVMRRALLAVSGSAVLAIIALHYVAAIHLLGLHDLLRRREDAEAQCFSRSTRVPATAIGTAAT